MFTNPSDCARLCGRSKQTAYQSDGAVTAGVKMGGCTSVVQDKLGGHLADEVGALAEAGLAALGRPRLGLADLQEGVGHAVHELRHRPRQLLHRV